MSPETPRPAGETPPQPAVRVLSAWSVADVADGLSALFDAQPDLLPRDTGARIVLKPNGNSCMVGPLSTFPVAFHTKSWPCSISRACNP